MKPLRRISKIRKQLRKLQDDIGLDKVIADQYLVKAFHNATAALNVIVVRMGGKNHVE